MNESERFFPTEFEVADHTIEMILAAYKVQSGVLPDYPWLGNPPAYSIDSHYANKYLEYIVESIRKAFYDLVPEYTPNVPAESLKRMVWQVYGALKLQPIREKDKKWNPIIYEPFFQFEEVGKVDQAPDKKRREYLDRELWSRNQEYSRAMSERFDYLSEFFSVTPSDKQKTSAILKTCFRDIEKVVEKMQIFCVLHGFDNPFDISDEPDAPISFSEDDQSPRADLWRIFRLSAAEKYLKQFLPEGMKKAEPYLFCFPFNAQEDAQDLTNQKLGIYERIYERKLLIYYFATPKLTILAQTQLQEVKRYLLDLASEIKSCKTNINYSPDDSWVDENSEEQSDIARVQFLYNRVENIRWQYTAEDIGHEAIGIFYTISQALQLFIDNATSRLSATIATKTLKNQIMDSLKLTLFTTLDHCLDTLDGLEEEPIPTMTSILREALNFLYPN